MSVRWSRRRGVPAVATVDASGGNESVVLTQVPTGDTLVVRRVDSSANTVTVTVASGLTLNGNPSGSATVAAGSEREFLSVDAGYLTVLATSAGGGGMVARRVLAAGAVLGSDATLYSGAAPTITPGVSGAGPTLSGPRIMPKKSPGGTVFDTANDPAFAFVGAIPGRYLLSSADMVRPDLLTGGGGQARRNNAIIRFVHTGQSFEFYSRAPGSNISYRLWIDGKPLTATATTITASPSDRIYTLVDFGSRGTREIGLEIADPEFGGVVLASAADSITRPIDAPPLLAGFGDSHTAGANGVGWNETWVRRAAMILNADFVNLGIGGSGYLKNAGAAPDYRTRLLTDIVPLAPDVLVLEGSWNDGGSTSAAVQAEAESCMSVLKANLPNTLLISAGPVVRSHILDTTLDGHDAAVRQAAQNQGWHGHISFRDPAWLKASTPAWAASTVYAVGDCVLQNGFVQRCYTAHTSTASFDQTKFRSTALVSGTGRVGATAGDGNADLLISSDNVHWSLEGHRVKARHIASEVLRIARAVAAGSTWAG